MFQLRGFLLVSEDPNGQPVDLTVAVHIEFENRWRHRREQLGLGGSQQIGAQTFVQAGVELAVLSADVEDRIRTQLVLPRVAFELLEGNLHGGRQRFQLLEIREFRLRVEQVDADVVDDASSVRQDHHAAPRLFVEGEESHVAVGGTTVPDQLSAVPRDKMPAESDLHRG